MDSFFILVFFKVNNGERVRFWHDPWCSREPLRVFFPNYYDLAVEKWGSVKDHLIRSRVFWSWNIRPRRNLNDWEVEEMGSLLELLEHYEIGDEDMQDEMGWNLDEEKGFTVKSMEVAL